MKKNQVTFLELYLNMFLLIENDKKSKVKNMTVLLCLYELEKCIDYDFLQKMNVNIKQYELIKNVRKCVADINDGKESNYVKIIDKIINIIDILLELK